MKKSETKEGQMEENHQKDKGLEQKLNIAENEKKEMREKIAVRNLEK